MPKATRPPSKRILALAARLHASTLVRFAATTIDGRHIVVEIPILELGSSGTPAEIGRAVEEWLVQVDKDLKKLESEKIRKLPPPLEIPPAGTSAKSD